MCRTLDRADLRLKSSELFGAYTNSTTKGPWLHSIYTGVDIS